MIGWLRKHAVLAVVLLDLMILPGVWLGRLAVELMFRGGKPCLWTFFGARCATCGGTHCVQSFLYGRFLEAFRWNQLVFCWILCAIVMVVLLNVWILLRQRWAGKVVRVMCSLEAFFIFVGSYLQFAFWRNVPMLLDKFF